MQRQLNLFRGKRQRGERPPTAKELALHMALEQLLLHDCSPFWRYTHIPSGELRDKRTAAKLKAMGVKPGWPDFMFVGPRQMFFLELKRAGEKPSDEQDAIGLHIISCGFGWLWTSSLEDAVATLKQLGIVRATVSA